MAPMLAPPGEGSEACKDVPSPCARPASGAGSSSRRLRSPNASLRSPRPQEAPLKSKATDKSSSMVDKLSHNKARDVRIETLKKVLGTADQGKSLWGTLCDRHSETGYWVDSNQFKFLICLVILVNAAYVGATADAGIRDVETTGVTDESTGVRLAFELVFLTAFSGELCLRLCSQGVVLFLQDRWTYFDVLLVLANVLEVVTIFVEMAAAGSLNTAAAVLRVLRAVRIMRVFQVLRMFRFVGELRLLLKGMVSAMRTLIWSMGMLSIVVYIFALMMTQYIGQTSENEETQYHFGSLGRSMFTLFTFVTLEGWPDIARHLLDYEPFGVPIVMTICIYILFTNLALLNLVTAVLVDSVTQISNSDDKKRLERFDKERRETVKRLEHVFSCIDKDGSGELSCEEFLEGMNNSKEVRETLTALQLTASDAEELFSLIDFDDNGKITMLEFIEGAIMCRAGDAVSRHLLAFQRDMRMCMQVLGHSQESVIDMLSGNNQGIHPDGTTSVQFALPKAAMPCQNLVQKTKRLQNSAKKVMSLRRIGAVQWPPKSVEEPKQISADGVEGEPDASSPVVRVGISPQAAGLELGAPGTILEDCLAGLQEALEARIHVFDESQRRALQEVERSLQAMEQSVSAALQQDSVRTASHHLVSPVDAGLSLSTIVTKDMEECGRASENAASQAQTTSREESPRIADSGLRAAAATPGVLPTLPGEIGPSESRAEDQRVTCTAATSQASNS